MKIVWIWLQNGTSAKKMCLFKISQASIKHNWGNVGNKKVRAPETLAFGINVQTYFYDVAKYSWVSPVHLDNQTFHFLVRISSRELFARDSTELDRTSLKVDLDHARSPHTTLILTTHEDQGIIWWKHFLPINHKPFSIRWLASIGNICDSDTSDSTNTIQSKNWFLSLPSDGGRLLPNLMQIVQVASRPNFVKLKVITVESYSYSLHVNFSKQLFIGSPKRPFWWFAVVCCRLLFFVTAFFPM